MFISCKEHIKMGAVWEDVVVTYRGELRKRTTSPGIAVGRGNFERNRILNIESETCNFETDFT